MPEQAKGCCIKVHCYDPAFYLVSNLQDSEFQHFIAIPAKAAPQSSHLSPQIKMILTLFIAQ